MTNSLDATPSQDMLLRAEPSESTTPCTTPVKCEYCRTFPAENVWDGKPACVHCWADLLDEYQSHREYAAMLLAEQAQARLENDHA